MARHFDPRRLLHLIAGLLAALVMLHVPYSARSAERAALSGAELAWLKQHGPIRFGFSAADRAPLDITMPSGEYRGMTPDFLALIRDRLDLPIEYVRFDNTTDLLAAAKAGRIAMAGSLISTPERDTYLTFSPPYAHNPRVLVARKDDSTISKLRDLATKTVAMEKGRASAELLRAEFPGITVLEVGSTVEALRTVAVGKAHAYVGGLLATSWAMQKEMFSNLEIKAEGGPTDTSLCFAVRRDLPVLAGIMKKGMENVTDEERDRVRRRWIALQGIARSGAFRIELTAAEQAWLRGHPTIRLGIRGDLSPLEIVEKDGTFHGAAADYIKLLGDRLGIDFIPVVVPGRRELAWYLKARELDAVAVTVPNAERASYLAFTKPLFSMPWVIVARADARPLKELNDLRGQTVALIEENSAHVLMREKHPGISVLAVKTNDEGLVAVVNNRAAAMVAPLAIISQRIQQQFPSDLKVVTAVSTIPGDFSMGVRRDWPELVGILNKGLASIDDSEHLAIRNKWLTVKYEFGTDWREVLKILAPILIALAIVIGVILTWNRRLQAQVVAREHAEEALLQAKTIAENANRMKSEFLANMSHELRTPLNGIIGFSEFLVDEKPGKLNEKQKEYLNDILNSGHHLLQLINDVLDLSKVEAGKMELFPENFSLPVAVEEACSVILPLARKKSVAIRQEISPTLESVRLDRQKFKQVLHNLLSNAVKFTDDGGLVTIVAGPHESGALRLQVRDTGIGISPADLGKLYVEFQQVDSGAARRYEGTGLGLALTKKIVEFQNGSIVAESAPGKGSAFTVILPLGVEGNSLHEPAVAA